MKITLPNNRTLSVRGWHYRNDPELMDMSVVDIMTDTEVLGHGVAYCCPPDRFVKKVGFRLALKRAMQQAGLSRPERTAVWKRLLGGK